MRNLVAGLIGALIGSISIVALLGLTQPGYSPPYDSVWFIFSGSSALQSTFGGLLNLSTLLAYFVTWIVIGILIAPFSKKGWNTVRSAIWIGVFQGIFALISILLTVPTFWESTGRNIQLIYQFSASLIVSLLSLISAYPLTIIIDQIRRDQEPPIPERIETRCQCGAVFKSNPLICSECGAILREVSD